MGPGPRADLRGWGRCASALAVCLWLSCPPAHAHGSATGLAGFAEGFVHPLLEPAQLVALIALILLIGQQGLATTRPTPTALAVGTAIGLLAAGLGRPLATDVPLLACAAAAGIAVAAARRAPALVYPLAAALVGLGIGLGSLPDGPTGGAVVAPLLGTWAGTWTWTIIGGNAVAALERPWTRVLVRVVASWMAACALLFLALTVAPHRGPPPIGAPGTLDVGR